jgi:hypothetical protein
MLVSAASRDDFSADTYVVQLDDDPSAPGATNTYELFLPSEGYGTTLTQVGPDHFQVSATTAPTAEIQFFSACNSATTCAERFRTFEFESNFLRSNDPNNPAPGSDIVFQQRAADVNFGGTGVTNYIANVLDEGFGLVVVNAGHVDVLSASSSASGGQLTPGVFFGPANEVVAEAGATPLVYSAGVLSVTTDGGTEQVTDTVTPPTPGVLRTAPSSIDDLTRQADNDLGAGRSDGEDFLTYTWTIGSGDVAGNLSGERLDRTVTTLDVSNPNTQPHGPRFVNQGTRSVDDVNIAVGIQDSGLTSTTDTTTFGLRVEEDYTGKTDTDAVAVTYQNAAPTSADAGPDLVFDAANTSLAAAGSVNDPDLAVNALIPGFEAHQFNWSVGGNDIATGANPTIGIADTGLSSTIDTGSMQLTATDRAGESAGDSLSLSYANALPSITALTADMVVGGLLFGLAVDDPDLGINSLIPDFERLTLDITVDLIDQTGFFADLLGTGSQFVDDAALLAAFGAGDHLLDVFVSDLAMVDAGTAAISSRLAFTVREPAEAPLPATAGLLLTGLAWLRLTRRRRPARAPA